VNAFLDESGRSDIEIMKKQFIVFVVALGCALLAWQWSDDTLTKPKPAREETGESTLKAPDKRQSGTATDSIRSNPQRESPEVVVPATRLSPRVSGRSLQEVINEIFQQSGVTIVMGNGMPNPLITMEFHDLPLEQGLRRLFEDYDTFFLYSRIEGMPARLTTVWVYPPGQGQKLTPIPLPPDQGQKLASISLSRDSQSDECAQDVNDPDAFKRALAIKTLAERHGNAAAEVVKMGLTDSDERVRIEALQAALNRQVEVPIEALKEMVQYDPSALIRSIAFAGLVNQAQSGLVAQPVVWELLNIAQRDSDPVVSELAARIAESWDEAAAESAATGTQDQTVDPQLNTEMSHEDSEPQ
jgi:hypothetical protein